MKVLVLGSAAGGGFPQWNCYCANCNGIRQGRIKAQTRTQSSIAISSDGNHWVLVNASPDIRQQINRHPEFHRQSDPRRSPFSAVLLTDAQIDHSSGLLFLREGTPVQLYATAAVQAELKTGLPLLNVLGHFCGVKSHDIAGDGSTFAVPGLPDIEVKAINLPGHPPRYSILAGNSIEGQVIALHFRDRKTNRSLFYAPGVARIEELVLRHLREADCVLIDGTFWSENEMAERGCGSKKASEMGHVPLSGAQGLLAALAKVTGPRKVLIHINNTNPILNEESEEHKITVNAGVEIAYDGMCCEI